MKLIYFPFNFCIHSFTTSSITHSIFFFSMHALKLYQNTFVFGGINQSCQYLCDGCVMECPVYTTWPMTSFWWPDLERFPNWLWGRLYDVTGRQWDIHSFIELRNGDKHACPANDRPYVHTFKRVLSKDSIYTLVHVIWRMYVLGVRFAQSSSVA